MLRERTEPGARRPQAESRGVRLGSGPDSRPRVFAAPLCAHLRILRPGTLLIFPAAAFLRPASMPAHACSLAMCQKRHTDALAGYPHAGFSARHQTVRRAPFPLANPETRPPMPIFCAWHHPQGKPPKPPSSLPSTPGQARMPLKINALRIAPQHIRLQIEHVA